jgi:hypothetical protein
MSLGSVQRTARVRVVVDAIADTFHSTRFRSSRGAHRQRSENSPATAFLLQCMSPLMAQSGHAVHDD